MRANKHGSQGHKKKTRCKWHVQNKTKEGDVVPKEGASRWRWMDCVHGSSWPTSSGNILRCRGFRFTFIPSYRKNNLFLKKTKLFVIGLFYRSELTLFKVEMSTKVVTFFMTKLKARMAPQTSSGGHYYSAFYLSMFTSEPVLQSLNICRNNLTIEHGIDEGNLSVFLCVCPCSAARFLSLSFRRRR